jgi:diguanylate cyclase (GGDEF)-like protein/PAS domain S-box-containing protein
MAPSSTDKLVCIPGSIGLNEPALATFFLPSKRKLILVSLPFHCLAASKRRQAQMKKSSVIGATLPDRTRVFKEPDAHDAQTFLKRILDAIPNPVFIKNDFHQWITFNDAFCRMMGKTREELIGKSDFDILPEDEARVFWEKDDLVFSGEAVNENEEPITDGNGETRWLLTIKAPFFSNGTKYLVGVITDITARKQAEAAVRSLALEDSLTGLPNRRLLKEHLQHAQADANRHSHSVALMIVDLDDFKHINDTLGHTIGDELLVEIARRLRLIVRECDVVARLGGDEFAILSASANDAEEFGALAERLVEQMSLPVPIGDVVVRSSASVGIAVNSGNVGDPGALLAQADLALYAAKAAGKNTWRFFAPAMQERACRLVELEQGLRHALDHGEFVLHYQPIVGMQHLELIGLEALIRWNHPTRGQLLPGQFLAGAERNRLIVPLTFWTITQALRQARAWATTGHHIRLMVNLAASIFEVEGIVEHITARLDAEGLPADMLTAEVTEGVLVDSRKAVAVLQRLRDIGVRVAIDDFGAGQSSLGRLDQLPVDLLKIDRSFITSTSARREAILRATVDLARSLDLRTVVEGIETAAQFALARRVGTDGVQGFLLARPMPPEEIPAWVSVLAERRQHDAQLDLLRFGA